MNPQTPSTSGCPLEAENAHLTRQLADTRDQLADAVRNAARWRRVAELIHTANTQEQP